MPRPILARESAVFPPRSDRRGAIRIVPPTEVRCELKGRAGSMLAKDISVSGIGVWRNAPLRAGIDHEMTITLGTFTLRRRARTVYSRKEAPGRWLLGLKFLPETQDDGKLEALIGLLATEFRVS